MSAKQEVMAMVPMGDLERMARAVATSNLFGVKSPEQALALMLVAQAEGRHPALAARDYDIIQGRPAKKAEAMLRDFIESGGSVQWHTLSDTVADATFSHPQGGTVRIDWTMDRAKTAGMGAKDMWKKFPRQMLRSRVVSEGVRTVCPMATSGMYVPEEVIEFKQEKNITPTAGAADRVSPDRQIVINELADKVKGWMAEGSLTDAFMEIDNAALEADEKVYLWTMFDSGLRRQLKEEAERVRVRNAPKIITAEVADEAEPATNVISDAQRKRLEARIAELKLDREAVKAECKGWFGKDHFADLDKEEYTRLDGDLEGMAVAEPEPLLTFEQGLSLQELLDEKKIDKARLLAAAEKKSGDVYLSLSQLPASFYSDAIAWIEKH